MHQCLGRFTHRQDEKVEYSSVLIIQFIPARGHLASSNDKCPFLGRCRLLLLRRGNCLGYYVGTKPRQPQPELLGPTTEIRDFDFVVVEAGLCHLHTTR